ncbi:MAG TPA: hypothetical protein VF080_19240 [Solirubrobacteraceae bacterium]
MATRFIEGLGGQFQRLEDQLASDMEEVARRMVDESAEQRQLRIALADQLTSDLGRRWLGAGQFVAGFCLSAAADLVG